MPLGTPLSTLLTMLKAAIGDSLSIGSQSDPLYIQLLSDKQQLLLGQFDFPFLRKRWDVATTIGGRFYTMATQTTDGLTLDLDLTRPYAVYTLWGAQWVGVGYGISEPCEHNALNPDTNITGWAQQQSDPIQKWQFTDGTHFEIWPVPTTASRVRFVGQRVLPVLLQPTDVALLDDQLLVLSVAVDVLALRKQPLAQVRLSYAQERLRSLRAMYPSRSHSVILGGRMRDAVWKRRLPIITVAGGGGVTPTPPEPPPFSPTADSTEWTADSTTVTADQQ